MSTATLAEQSAARKQKLEALAKRKADSISTGEQQARSKKLEFRFRNYDPTINGPKRHDPIEHSKHTVEETVKGVMEKVKVEDQIRRAGELDLTKIQPKKLNWDLKRDLDKKLSKLEPITQAAFATLIRKRMQAEGAMSTDEGAAALVKEINSTGQKNLKRSDDQSSDEDDSEEEKQD